MSTLRGKLVRLAASDPELQKELLPILKEADVSATLPKAKRNTPAGNQFLSLMYRYITDFTQSLMKGKVPEDKMRTFIQYMWGEIHEPYGKKNHPLQENVIEWAQTKFVKDADEWLKAYGTEAQASKEEVLSLMHGMDKMQVSIAWILVDGEYGMAYKARSDLTDHLKRDDITAAKYTKLLEALKWAKGANLPKVE